MQTKTKIICTIGPSVASYEKIVELIEAGMNVARLNMSHGTYEGHRKIIQLLQKAREEKGANLAIMLDTKGPEIRLGEIPGGALDVLPLQKIYLSKEDTPDGIKVIPEIVFDFLLEGMKILFDDGYIGATVVGKDSTGVFVEMENTGILKTHKGVNIPGVTIPLPAMTEEDKEALIFACKERVDIIAASFVRSADHVREIKHFLATQGRPDIAVIAKIEDRQGVENFKSIVEAADGIMVARGDLGVELPLHEVPSLQKMMIRECYPKAKPVITATQMLESMIYHPRPTRAEVSDVANAIYDSSSAVMLSGETAMGFYPISVVQMMKSIIQEAEDKFLYDEFFQTTSTHHLRNISFSVAKAAVKTAYNLEAKAIFALTSSGLTARVISSFRPKMPIIVLTPSQEVYYQMALTWGVIAAPPCSVESVEEAFIYLANFAKQRKIVSPADTVVLTAGSSFGVKGSTNMLIVEKI